MQTEREPFVPPSLGRGANSWCALDGTTLDSQHFSPMINGGRDFDAACRKLAADLAAGQAIKFRYASLTDFGVEITPEAAIDGGLPDWVGKGRPGYHRLDLRIGRKGRETTYYHALKGDSYEYVQSKHQLKDHDSRAIAYLLGALGEAVREIQDRPVRVLGTSMTAKRLGLDQSTVGQMCRDGRLPGAYRSQRWGWHIPEDAVPTSRAIGNGPEA